MNYFKPNYTSAHFWSKNVKGFEKSERERERKTNSDVFLFHK